MRPFAAVAVAAAIAAGSPAAHAAMSFSTIDNPADPTFNQLLGINDAGVISGYFGSGLAGHPNQGYTIAKPYTVFANANLPGSLQTQATEINDAGVVTGFWSPTNTGNGDANYGFIRIKDHGRFEYLSVNDPRLANTAAVAQVLGINASDIAVGFYNDANGKPHGFAYNAVSGAFTPVNVAATDAATGINKNNLICGFFTDGKGVMHAFLKPLAGGTAVPFTVPGSQTTQFLGVNNNGIAVGFFLGQDTFPHGVIYNPANGKWQQVDDPSGVTGTVLNGINNRGQIVGLYTDAAGNTHGMLINGAP